MKRLILILLLLLLVGAEYVIAANFEYSYGDPTLAASQTYIYSTSNAELRTERDYKYWKPMFGASTEGATEPGLVTYHFNFADPIADAHLYLNMPTFHWSYSKGHNYLYASADGQNWEQLMEVVTPAYSEYTWGAYNAMLPDSVIGINDIWLQARLYSFGPSASTGGVLTNTSQLNRYDIAADSTTFSLDVNFTAPPVPVPTTLLLLGSGILGLAGIARRSKK